MSLHGDQEQSIPDRGTGEASSLYYPDEIRNDLDAVNLPQSIKNQVRAVIIATIAEFRGELIDITKGDHVLGHSVEILMGDLFKNQVFSACSQL